ncbi:hypothetical protein DTO96_100091 [Ephemeroptericola cinctiostellae]|uniref:Lipopolysaccharide assembly protein A domain-containing protein n=1 Tax=Ephemeroptericola cinctiostellae TaxID=2268024 RepID=A0A345D7Q0_9BURK|nr:LapA family protein [Ephemeroptericola cinctiostellae]AXF84388.1 hypothetical protein DTO96_100091 [Ephemeroptericola cinctiostellae]
MIKLLSWLVITFIVVILMWTILGDITPVTFGLADDIPQKWVASGFFVLGIVLGWLLMLPKNLALRWSVRRLRKENLSQKSALEKSPGNSSVVDNSIDVPPLTM